MFWKCSNKYPRDEYRKHAEMNAVYHVITGNFKRIF